jgi:hypothetical protein
MRALNSVPARYARMYVRDSPCRCYSGVLECGYGDVVVGPQGARNGLVW